MAAPELSGVSKHPKDLPFSPLLFLPSPEGRPAPHPHPNLPFAEPRGDSGLSPVPSQPEVKCRQKANHRRRGQALAGGWPGPEPACLTPGQGCGKAGDEDQPEDRDGCGQAPPRGGGDRSCLRSREPAATFHGKNVFRPPPPRGQGAPAHDSSLCCRHRIASQTARLRARPGSVPSPGEASPSGDPLPAETPAPRPGTGGPASTGNVLRDAALTGEVGRVSGDGICLGPRSPRGVPWGDLEGAPMRGASWP